jgi:hypothetical protein
MPVGSCSAKHVHSGVSDEVLGDRFFIPSDGGAAWFVGARARLYTFDTSFTCAPDSDRLRARVGEAARQPGQDLRLRRSRRRRRLSETGWQGVRALRRPQRQRRVDGVRGSRRRARRALQSRVVTRAPSDEAEREHWLRARDAREGPDRAKPACDRGGDRHFRRSRRSSPAGLKAAPWRSMGRTVRRCSVSASRTVAFASRMRRSGESGGSLRPAPRF